MAGKRPHSLWAVLTGDIVGYSRTERSQRRRIVDALKASLQQVDAVLPSQAGFRFQMYRGDSFQGVMGEPQSALRAAVLIRAGLRSKVRPVRRRLAPDCRIAIGIGAIDSPPRKAVSEGDGEAFRRSGPALDSMKGDRRLLVNSPWPEVDRELAAECALLDLLVGRWSPQQAEAMIAHLRGVTQADTAKMMGISQPAVVSRLKAAGGSAVEGLCERYEYVVSSHISP